MSRGLPERGQSEVHITIALGEMREYLDIPESATLVGILRDLVKRTRGERVTTYDESPTPGREGR